MVKNICGISHLMIWKDQVDPTLFFRLNRQYLASVSSIQQIHQYFKSRLKIDLLPKTTDEVTVSREKATSFKRWMDGN